MNHPLSGPNGPLEVGWFILTIQFLLVVLSYTKMRACHKLLL